MGELVLNFLEKTSISANETRLCFLLVSNAEVAHKLFPIERGIVAWFMAGLLALDALDYLRIYVKRRNYSQKASKAWQNRLNRLMCFRRPWGCWKYSYFIKYKPKALIWQFITFLKLPILILVCLFCHLSKMSKFLYNEVLVNIYCIRYW